MPISSGYFMFISKRTKKNLSFSDFFYNFAIVLLVKSQKCKIFKMSIMKKRNLLLCMFALLVSLAVQADIIAYAQYANGTLTFRYGEFTPDGATSWDVSNTAEGEYPAFLPSSLSWDGGLTKVVFDPSFADARPKSCGSWFDACKNLASIEGLEYLNTSEVTRMDCMFEACPKLTSLDLSHFDTGNVTNMTCMFAGAKGLTELDLSSFNTAKVESMTAMFAGSPDGSAFYQGANQFKTIYVGDGWTTVNVTESGGSPMFDYCPNLVGGNGTTWSADHTDMTYARIDAPGAPGYFSRKVDDNSPFITFADPKVKALCVANWDTDGDGELSKDEAAAVTDFGSVFNGNNEITSFNELQYFTGLLCNDEDLSGNTYSGIPYFAFMGCANLKQVTLPSVEAIGHAAFSYSGLTAITIPNSVRIICDEAFYNTKISEFVLPANVTELCDGYEVAGIISSPNLKSIVVKSGNAVYDSRDNCNAIVTTASNQLVNGCATTTIPATVTRIRQYAFMGCTGLTAITIPNSVTSIDNYAFEYCDNLTSVTVENPTPFTIGYISFPNCANATLHVPAGSKAAYEAADCWKEFKEIVEPVLPGSAEAPFTCAEAIAFVSSLEADTPTETEYYVKGKVCEMAYNFDYKYGNGTFWISDDGTSEGKFYVYRTMYFGNETYSGGRVPNIGDEVVICGKMVYYRGTLAETLSHQCRLISLNGKTAGKPLANDDLFCFQTAEGLDMYFVVDDNGCSVGYAVSSRSETYSGVPTAIEAKYTGEVTVPATAEDLLVRTIAPSAFSGANLSAITIPASVFDIETNAFKDCQNLASVKMPENVVLNNGTFMNCTSLSSVELPKGVQLWANDLIFKDCSNLTSIKVNDKTPYAFQDENHCLVDDPSSVTLYVPAGSKAAYEAAEYWKEFQEIVESAVEETELWSGSYVIRDWNYLGIAAEDLTSLMVGDVLHVAVTDVLESEAYVALLDGNWRTLEAWYGVSPDKTEAVFTLTGDMVRALKERGMVLTCHGYTVTRVYTTPAYDGGRYSVWLGRQTGGDVVVDICHFQNSNRNTGVKAGDSIRLTYSGDGMPRLGYSGEDNGWQWTELPGTLVERIGVGADLTVTGDIAKLLNNNNLIVQLADGGLTLTVVELVSGANTVVYEVPQAVSTASGTEVELTNITLTYGQAGSPEFLGTEIWTCTVEGYDFDFYTPGNGVNGNREGGTFYVFKPKKNGLLTVVVKQNANKALYVEESGVVMADFNGVVRGEQFRGGYTFEVKANRTYKVYCTGSKLGFYGFIYDWLDNADLINIDFACDYTKQICVAAFDTNGDGELSEAEAAAVTDEQFKTQLHGTGEAPESMSFDELQYFTGLTVMPQGRFAGVKYLTSIILPESMTSIETNAFRGCERLATVGLPLGLQTLGECAFLGSGITSIKLPAGVKEIPSQCFLNCRSLADVDFGSVERIGDGAFARSGITSVSLPLSVKWVGSEAFKNCPNLQGYVDLAYIEHLGAEAFSACPLITMTSIPPTIDIDENSWGAFSGCTGLETVEFFAGTTRIDNLTFVGCQNLRNLPYGLPSTLESIGHDAFNGCGLESIAIPKGVTLIQENAFKDCNNLVAVMMENPVPIVLENAETFSNRQNATLVVPAGSEEAYRQADVWREFGAITSFVDIVENGNLETDDTGCFFAKHAEQSDEVVPATIADGEGTDGSRCLAITSIDDPVNVWDTQFFVRMPQLLLPGTIYHVSFDYRASRDGQVNLECHGEPTEYLAPYKSLWFGTDWQHFDYTGVITAEQSHDDIAMRTIAFTLGENRRATTFYLDNIVFEIDQTHQVENIINFEDPRVKLICVNNWDLNGDGELSESEAARVTALGQVFRDNHEITTFRELQHFVGLTDISECAFEGCWNLTAVELPRHVTVIRHDAFTLTGLQTIDLFNVKKLEYCAFLNSALTELYIPGTVTEFDGWSQFNGCPNLKRVEFGDGAENLCNAVFENSPELEEVILPASLDGWMGASLLGNCPKLKRVEIRSGNSSMTHTFLMGGGDTDNQVHFVVPDGTADEFLKKGFVNLSDLSALDDVKAQLTYEAQSVEALLDAGEYTASSEAVAALREAIGNARSAEVQGYTDVLQNIDLLHSHAKTFLKQATFNPGVEVTALLVQNPAFYSYPFGWNVTPNGAVSTLYNESRMENAEAYVDHFVERWTYEGDADQAAEKLDDGGITQTITQLPAGKYRLEATVIASNNHDNCPATGAFLVAGTNSVEVGSMPALPERASLEFTQAEDGDCTVGLELVGTTANWVALDNVRIYCLGSVDAPVGQTADHLYAEAVELRAGAVAEVALNLSNEKTYTAYQFDLLLPEGIDIATDENGKLLVAKGDRYTDASQRLKVEKTADNTYQFLCVSMSNAELTGNDGTILTFTLKADGSLPTGAELQALLQQVKLVQPDGTLLTAPDTAIGISITRPLKPGDANDDGDIDVADPVAMINYILGRPTVKFLFAAADVNQDNQVDVFDVMKVINMTFAKNAARQLGRLLEPSADQMTIDGFNIEVGETKTLGIALANTAAYAGFQFSLVLPQGITVKSYAPTSRIPADIGVSMQQQTDGSYLFIGTAWEEDVTLVGNSGAIIDITVTADDTMAEGALTGYFRSVKLSDANGVGVTYHEMSFPINSTTGLELALASGWNWISTSQADASQRDARTFLSPIVDDVLRLLSQTQELVNDGQYGIVGNLQTLEVGSAYKLNTNKATTLSLKGETADVAATRVHLSKGWNWLGYVPTVALPVATAFENLQASADDRIISLTDGVAAYDGSAWVGDFTMRPGEGYLYFAHADVDFVYSSSTSAPAGSRPQVDAPSPAPWFCDVHQYPDVTTIIATVSTGGESAWSGSQSLQVGAFCGDECRGIARWVDGLLFLAVHGTQGRGETITFRAADAETGAEMAFSEQLTFNGQCEGTLSAPMQLTLSSVITAISPSSLHPQPSTFYTLDGRMVGRQWRSLPEGVYVMITTFPDGTTARQKVMKK